MVDSGYCMCGLDMLNLSFFIRMEDITEPECLRIDPKTNRTVSFYGWMRGVPLKHKSTVHIPGMSYNPEYITCYLITKFFL